MASTTKSKTTSKTANAAMVLKRAARAKPTAGGKPRRKSAGAAKATPPAGSIAAAQKVLRAVERKENTLRAVLKRQRQAVKRLKKAANGHRGTVKALESELDKVCATRKNVAKDL